MDDYKSVSGKSLGLPEDCFVRYNEKTGDKKTVKVKGRRVYIKKCRREEEVGGIILCDKSRDDVTLFLVLAIGDKCGKGESLSDVNRNLEWKSSGVVKDFKVGDKVRVPDVHEGIMRSPYGEDEFFIWDDLIEYVLEQ